MMSGQILDSFEQGEFRSAGAEAEHAFSGEKRPDSNAVHAADQLAVRVQCFERHGVTEFERFGIGVYQFRGDPGAVVLSRDRGAMADDFFEMLIYGQREPGAAELADGGFRHVEAGKVENTTARRREPQHVFPVLWPRENTVLIGRQNQRRVDFPAVAEKSLGVSLGHRRKDIRNIQHITSFFR